MLTLLHGGEASNFTLEDLMDPELLRTSAETMLKGIMAQVLHRHMVSASNDWHESNVLGFASYQQDRLHVKARSTSFLCTRFALMSILTIMLLFVSPNKPKTIGAIGSALTVALVLQASDTGFGETLSEPTLKKPDPSSPFYSRKHPQTGVLSIEIYPVQQMTADQSRPSATQSKGKNKLRSLWWQPAATQVWHTAITVALCVILIGVLELVQQLSDKRGGFVNINPEGYGSAIL